MPRLTSCSRTIRARAALAASTDVGPVPLPAAMGSADYTGGGMQGVGEGLGLPSVVGTTVGTSALAVGTGAQVGSGGGIGAAVGGRVGAGVGGSVGAAVGTGVGGAVGAGVGGNVATGVG